MKEHLEQVEEDDKTLDDEAWNNLTKDITKIESSEAVSTVKIKARKIDPAKNIHIEANKQSLPKLTEGNFDNIDAQTVRRFKREGFSVEATLDLHGISEAVAFDKVTYFIKSAYSRGLRAVIIVTGKGIHLSDDNDIFPKRAVLKNKVPEWLNLPEIRPFILSYIHPSAKLGGTGALYILLRRKR